HHRRVRARALYSRLGSLRASHRALRGRGGGCHCRGARAAPRRGAGPGAEGQQGGRVIPIEYYLAVAGVVFLFGSLGFLMRRNVLVQLMCIELLLNSVNLTLVAFNRTRQDDYSGQMFAFFVIAVAAAEAAVGLAIALSLYRLSRSVRSDEADLLRN